jgi:hypothetical protein
MPPLLCTNFTDIHTTDETKSVRFQEQTSIQVFAIVKEVDKGSCWMGPEDFLQIRHDCIDAIRSSCNPFIRAKREFRGLEHKTQLGAQRRIENRAKARRAVLDEQMYQSETGFKDPEYIATLYRTITHRSRVEANIMGIRDEMAAKKCTNGMKFQAQTIEI